MTGLAMDRAAAVFLCASLWVAVCAGAEAESSWERYKVLVERNMFLPDRSRPARPTHTPVVRSPQPRTNILLRGVVRQGDECIAFVEDTRSGVTSRVRAGDTLANGHVAQIGLDYLFYARGDETIRVELGDRVAALGQDESLSSEASDETAQATQDQDAGEAALLERLRRRREQELNKP